jgi:DNA-directed RNA polymerase subunit RPC12/RpoP
MRKSSICGNCGKRITRRGLIDGRCPYCGTKVYEEFEKIRNKIIKERGNKCEFCGAEGIGTNSLTVHHLDFNPMNNDPKNLVVLCAKCHLKFQNRFTITKDLKRITDYVRKE